MCKSYIFYFFQQNTVQLGCLGYTVVEIVTVAIKSLAKGKMVYVIAQAVNQDGGETHVTKVCIYFLPTFLSLV